MINGYPVLLWGLIFLIIAVVAQFVVNWHENRKSRRRK